jgi:PAS domain-containing protein
MTPAGTVVKEEDVVSHGLCRRCARDFMIEELGEPLNEFLDRLGVPVIVVGPEFVVSTANKQACALIGKDLSEIQHGYPGDVIECAHAQEPSGCGEQIHCTACTIRLKVKETFETGESFENVQAYPGACLFEDVRRMSIEISTQKVGEVVFLTIENLDTLIS